MVVVYKGEADTPLFFANADSFSYVLKLPFALVAQQMDAVAQAYGEVSLAIVIKIAGRAAQAAARERNAGSQRHICKLSVSQVAQKMARAVGCATHQKKVGPAVTIKIEEARASACSNRGRRTALRNERAGFYCKVHGNCSGHFGCTAGRQFRQRVLALIAIARAEGCSEMLRCNFLEARQVFARGRRITFALQGARQSEFGRSMDGIQRQSLLECSDRFVIFLLLGVEITDKVIGVCLVGLDFRHVAKRGDPFFRVAHIFVRETEVVPSVGIVRKLPGCFRQFVARGLEFLLP